MRQELRLAEGFRAFEKFALAFDENRTSFLPIDDLSQQQV